MTVATDFRITGKPAYAGGFKSCFLAEARRPQRKTNKMILTLQKTHMSLLRSLRLCESQYL
jgi:hypothetical protein